MSEKDTKLPPVGSLAWCQLAADYVVRQAEAMYRRQVESFARAGFAWAVTHAKRHDELLATTEEFVADLAVAMGASYTPDDQRPARELVVEAAQRMRNEIRDLERRGDIYRDAWESEERQRLELQGQLEQARQACDMLSDYAEDVAGHVADDAVAGEIVEDEEGPVEVNAAGGRQSAIPVRLDLIPPLAFLRVGEICKTGSARHGEENWRRISCKDHLNHALRHLYEHLAGATDEDHLGNAACRCLMALEQYLVAARQTEAA